MIEIIGVPYGSRTRVAAVKGRCPRPLDERDACRDRWQEKRTSYGSVGEKALSNCAVDKWCPDFVSWFSFGRRRNDPRNHTKPHEEN